MVLYVCNGLKPRGAPLGAVKLREELFVRTGFPEEVPDDLKEAREESGQSTEYRATDKAKLRKRNKDAIKQQKAKKRAKDSDWKFCNIVVN